MTADFKTDGTRDRTTIDWPALLAAHPPLARLPQALRAAARRLARERDAPLFRQGQRPQAMYYLLEGELRLLRHGADGGALILQRAQGGFVAEASLDARIYHCDAVAASAIQALRLPLSAFRAALAQDAAFNRAWIGHLSAELRRVRAQAERLALPGAADRVLHYLQTEGHGGQITLDTSRKAWAAELGLTHECLYRTLRGLREAGRVCIAGRHISLRPPP